MFIQNVALNDVKNGFHRDAGSNSMLIQIVDPDMDFPLSKKVFKETYQFKFLDLEKDDPYKDELKITDDQAHQLVELLQKALKQNMNVIVHCVAGVCRSGAVAEVGIMMGFQDTYLFRSPNLLVKHKMMKALGWSYDENEPYTINGKPFQYDELGNKKFLIPENMKDENE